MPLGTGLDPDRDSARDLLAEELAEAQYHRPESLLERAAAWLAEQFERLLVALPGAPGLSSVLLVLVGCVVVAAAAFALWGTRRRARLLEPRREAVLEETGMGAEDYRRRAARARQRGDWDSLLLDSFRALATGASERTLLPAAEGMTASEVAAALGRSFPSSAGELREVARAFDVVRYGDGHAGQAAAERSAALEQHLSHSRPEPTGRMLVGGGVPAGPAR